MWRVYYCHPGFVIAAGIPVGDSILVLRGGGSFLRAQHYNIIYVYHEHFHPGGLQNNIAGRSCPKAGSCETLRSHIHPFGSMCVRAAPIGISRVTSNRSRSSFSFLAAALNIMCMIFIF